MRFLPNLGAFARIAGFLIFGILRTRGNRRFCQILEDKMTERARRYIHWTLAVVAAWGIHDAAWAQTDQVPLTAGQQNFAPSPYQPGTESITFDEIRARFDQQDAEICRLQAQLAGIQPSPSPTSGAYVNQTGAAATPAAPSNSPPTGTVVGSNLSGVVFFKDGEFLNFSTPNKDFTMHLGGWVQWDNVWWNQANALKVAQGTGTATAPFKAGNQPGIASGAANGGMNAGTYGELQDGDYWRRLRVVQEGTFWETGEYRFNWAFENDQFSTVGLDEMWVGQNQLPVIGTVRAGHVKTPIGLEADMASSSRCMTFMERSSYSEAIELNQNFCTGLWAGSSYLNDRVTYQAAMFRPDNANSGDFFGTDEYGLQARMTCLPLYEDQGRHLLHLGISGGWRNGANNLANANYIGDTITLQARPELRDDDPAGGGPGVIPNANSNRMISTGAMACDNDYLMGLETLYIRGPFSFQAEYGWNWMNNASGIITIPPASTPAAPRLTTPTDYMFNGGYVQVAYTLTGENRAYDKKSGTLSRYYFGNQGPYENAWIVRDADGHLCWGRGAWEIAARYSYVNLNDGFGATRVQGGIMEGFGIALNWYVNTNLTINTEWIWDNRYDLPTASAAVPGSGTTIPGAVSAFGTRLQYSF
jgi:phosphate-selective porin OprO and OprP